MSSDGWRASECEFGAKIDKITPKAASSYLCGGFMLTAFLWRLVITLLSALQLARLKLERKAQEGCK